MNYGQFAEALEAYRDALQRAPRRYNSLLGAARSADGADDVGDASRYYRELVKIAEESGGVREATREARAYVEG